MGEGAKVLYDVKNTDLIDFFTAQVGNKEAIEALFNEYLDGDGMPKVKRKKFMVEGFDMDAFI